MKLNIKLSNIGLIKFEHYFLTERKTLKVFIIKLDFKFNNKTFGKKKKY